MLDYVGYCDGKFNFTLVPIIYLCFNIRKILFQINCVKTIFKSHTIFLKKLNKISKEELLEEKGALSKIMLIEKEERIKDLVCTIFDIDKRIQNDKNKEIVYTAIKLGLEKKFGSKITNKIMEKIVRKESGNVLISKIREKRNTLQ